MRDKKWIHLRSLDTENPQYAVEGMTYQEAIGWLVMLTDEFKQKIHTDTQCGGTTQHKLTEYDERSC